MYPPTSARPLMCPRCGGPVERVRRRPIDRVLSMVRRLRRYRCRNVECRWEGTLRGVK